MIIGITGVIGSGKSSVCSILASQGAFIIDADTIAKELYKKNQPGYIAIKNNLGNDYISDDSVNIDALSEFVFSDSENREFINSLIHPLVKNEVIRRINFSEAILKIIDAALLFEGKLNELCDEIWVVVTSETNRIVRIMERDGCSEEDAKNRLSAQHNDKFFIERADLIIENNYGINQLQELILNILNEKKQNF